MGRRKDPGGSADSVSTESLLPQEHGVVEGQSAEG